MADQLGLDLESEHVPTGLVKALDVGAALQLVGAPPAIAGMFHRMEIADEVLNAYTAEHPDQPNAQQAFRVCTPSRAVPEMVDVFYRAHVRELAARAGRVCTPTEMAAATAAEMLHAFSEASLRAPLNTDAMAAIEHLLAVSGLGAEIGIQSDQPYWERHQRQATELIGQLQEKMACPNRRDQWQEELAACPD